MSTQLSSSGLWKHANFLKLWIGETVSLFGSQVTIFALPLIAALSLHASPVAMGILSAAEYAPMLLFGLFAGVITDRLACRPILILTDVGRALILLSLPLCAYLGLLNMVHLYIVAFLTGTLSIFFDVAYQAFLPDLVTKEQLVNGNSKLELSRAVAQMAGPSFAGGLVQLVTAPIAVTVDAVSFLLSAVFLLSIKPTNPANLKHASKQGVLADILEGIKAVVSQPILRFIVGATGLFNLFMGVITAGEFLYLVQDLKITPIVLGIIFSISGPSSLVGSLLAERISIYLGIGRAITFGGILIGLGCLCIPLASRSLALILVLLVLSQIFLGLGSPIYNINAISLRQAITPSRLLGRVNASARFVILGTLPLGSLIGGVSSERFGLRLTLFISAICMVLTFASLIISPVFALRERPMDNERDEI